MANIYAPMKEVLNMKYKTNKEVKSTNFKNYQTLVIGADIVRKHTLPRQ